MSESGGRLDAIRQRRAAITRPPWDSVEEATEFHTHAAEDVDYLLRCVDRLEAMVRERIRQVEQLKGRLRELEWSDTNGCPVCMVDRGERHTADCWLAAAIKSV